jgi:hypothetical protein
MKQGHSLLKTERMRNRNLYFQKRQNAPGTERDRFARPDAFMTGIEVNVRHHI